MLITVLEAGAYLHIVVHNSLVYALFSKIANFNAHILKHQYHIVNDKMTAGVDFTSLVKVAV